MSNGFKNNPLACGLLGFILGSGGTLGGQAVINHLSTDHSNLSHPTGLLDSQFNSQIPQNKPTNFDKVPFDPDGQYVITEGGKKYHYNGCYTLSQSSKLQRVNADDAENAGLTPCSKCVK